MKIDQRNKNFYTEKGLAALIAKTKTYITIFNDNKFPFSGQILGFGQIEVNDSKELLAKILELSNLTGFRAKLNLDKGSGVATITY